LRLHTESTLADLEDSTVRLGQILRKFKEKTCATYETYDLPSEEAARGRRKAKLSAQGKGKQATGRTTKKKRDFNLDTYKFHSLGDYASTIRLFGTSDNTSTQLVCFPFN
jgi:hypothetical protein